MPFGLCDVAQTIQHLILEILQGLDFVFAYSDGLLIASSSEREHLHHLELFLAQHTEYRGLTKLEFLGHTISASGIAPLNSKVTVIREFLLPNSVCKLREFLGLVSFYGRFIPRCATTLQPLTDLLSSKLAHDFCLPDSAVSAFRTIKNALATATLLVHPSPSAPYCLMVDASNTAVGSVLQQKINKIWHPISFF